LDDVPVVLANGVENTTPVIGVLPMKSVPMVSAETDPKWQKRENGRRRRFSILNTECFLYLWRREGGDFCIWESHAPWEWVDAINSKKKKDKKEISKILSYPNR
jgi:hypothetical protein